MLLMVWANRTFQTLAVGRVSECGGMIRIMPLRGSILHDKTRLRIQDGAECGKNYKVPFTIKGPTLGLGPLRGQILGALYVFVL